MAEQSHAQLYKGLPPVRRSLRPWLIAAIVFAGIIGVATVVVVQAHHATGPSSLSIRRSFGVDLSPMFDRYSLIWTLGAFIVAGTLGIALARGWWRIFAIDLVGLAIALELTTSAYSVFYRAMFAWFFWVFGVSAGAAVGDRMLGGRLRAVTRGRPRFPRGAPTHTTEV